MLALVYSDSAAPPTARNTAEPGPARRRARSVDLPSKRRGVLAHDATITSVFAAAPRQLCTRGPLAS